MLIFQDSVRDALMDYWGACCPLTGIKEPSRPTMPTVCRASPIPGTSITGCSFVYDTLT
jgi:hypothetical protein